MEIDSIKYSMALFLNLPVTENYSLSDYGEIAAGLGREEYKFFCVRFLSELVEYIEEKE